MLFSEWFNAVNLKTFKFIFPFLLYACAHQAELQLERINATGREDVRVAMRKSLASIRDCYMAIYEDDHSVQGEMNFGWEIHSGGEAKAIRAFPSSTSLKNPQLESCIANVISKIRFPEPPEKSLLIVNDYFFRFQGKDEKTYIELKNEAPSSK